MRLLLSLFFVASFQIPQPEVSGLGWFPRRADTLVSIGDKEHTVVFVDLTAKPSFRTLDLGPLFENRSGSQWEAVASDSSGRIFVLEEDPGHVFVLDESGRAIESTIALDVPHDHDLHDRWQADPNSRGEGLVLLRNGHLLIAKEKKPSALIEFGPVGEKPSGYRAGDAVTGKARFPLPGKTSSFVPLAVWPVVDKRLKDVSELAVGPEGDLYLLSDKSNRIAQAELPLSPESPSVALLSVGDLPKRVEKAEGLALGERGTWIGVDAKEDEPNLFQFEPVQARR